MQSRIESLVEQGISITIGFLVSLLMWMWVVAPLISNHYLTAGGFVDSLTITTLFTITSLARGYIVRRVFTVRYPTRIINWWRNKYV